MRDGLNPMTAVKRNNPNTTSPSHDTPQNAEDRWLEVASSILDLAAQTEGPERTGRVAGRLVERAVAS